MSTRSEILNVVASAQKVMAIKRIEGMLMGQDNSNPNNNTNRDTSHDLGQQHYSNKPYIPSSPAIPRPPVTTILGARDNRTEFFDTWSRKIDQFVRDQKEKELHLPPELNSNDRRVLHSLSDKYNLSHTSVGRGPERHLVLRKDAIFYKAAQASGGNALVDSRGISQLKFKKEDTKGSKYHLRRAVHAGVDEEGRLEDGDPMPNTITDGSYTGDTTVLTGKTRYADPMAVKAHRQLKNANNEYSYAVDRPTHLPQSVFMASEEHPTGHNAPRGDIADVVGPWAQAIHSEKAAIRGITTHPSIGSGGAPVLSHNNNNNNNNNNVSETTTSEIVCYWEQCTGCGTSTELDYDTSEWEALGHCPKCDRKTVWRLVEKRKHIVIPPPVAPVVPPEPETIDKDDDDVDINNNNNALSFTGNKDRITGHKRDREESNNTAVDCPILDHGVPLDDNNNNEAIDVEDEDEAVELDVDDAVLNASCISMKSVDIEWIRAFAEHPSFARDPAVIGRHLMFVMEFRDVPTRSPLLLSKGGRRVYIKLREPRAEGNNNNNNNNKSTNCVTKLVQEVIEKLYKGVVDDVFVGFPNSSICADDAEALVHGPYSDDYSEILITMKKLHGSRNFVFSHTLEGVL